MFNTIKFYLILCVRENVKIFFVDVVKYTKVILCIYSGMQIDVISQP